MALYQTGCQPISRLLVDEIEKFCFDLEHVSGRLDSSYPFYQRWISGKLPMEGSLERLLAGGHHS